MRTLLRDCSPASIVAFLISLITLYPLPVQVAAQGDCFPPDDSHEAQLLAALAVPLAFSLAQAPQAAVPPGNVQLGLELTYLPEIDSVIRTPTICRPGKPAEHTDLVFALPRPRVWV